jgi:hypothetical protein
LPLGEIPAWRVVTPCSSIVAHVDSYACEPDDECAAGKSIIKSKELKADSAAGTPWDIANGVPATCYAEDGDILCV